MQSISIPNKSLTWCKQPGSDSYMTARASVLIEVWNENTNSLLERRWDKDGGVFGDDNHPAGSGISVPDGAILKVIVYNLSTNRLPMKVVIFNSDTPNTNIPNTYPKGMVDGNGAVLGDTSLILYKEIIGGEKAEMRFVASANTFNWWKINCNCMFGNATGLASGNPNNGIDYGASFFNIDYENNNIRWNNPNISSGNQHFFPNTATWPIESGTAPNPFYSSGSGSLDCSLITQGRVLAIWNNAGDGINFLLNQPFEAWNLNGDGFWALKVLKKDIDNTPLAFEVRGRDLFTMFSLQAGITSVLVGCLMGQNTGYNYQAYATPNGYYKDGNVYKKTTVPSAPIPNNNSIILGAAITGTANQAGTIKVYELLSSVVLATIPTVGNTNTWSWTPGGIGQYRFKNDNANGLSSYSTVVSVGAAGAYDYEIDSIKNDCQKVIEYGIKRTPVSQIEWQSSNFFLNVSEPNPVFFLRDSNSRTLNSESFMPPIEL